MWWMKAKNDIRAQRVQSDQGEGSDPKYSGHPCRNFSDFFQEKTTSLRSSNLHHPLCSAYDAVVHRSEAEELLRLLDQHRITLLPPQYQQNW
jgi:hypothetical protein